MKTTFFAGGCFWCVEHDFRELDGVSGVKSGYAKGTKSNNDLATSERSEPEEESQGAINPTYQNHRGYREAVAVTYDESKTNFKKLCQFFFDHIDPTDNGGQFHDRGESYKTAIFYENENEMNTANLLLSELSESGIYQNPIAVDIMKFGTYFDAEEYHQNYADKNSEHYKNYRKASGREELVQNTCEFRKKFPWKD